MNLFVNKLTNILKEMKIDFKRSKDSVQNEKVGIKIYLIVVISLGS